MSIVVYGPQGCGKTTAKDALAEHFGMRHVIDDWVPGSPLPPDALALTNITGVKGAIDFKDALEMLTAA